MTPLSISTHTENRFFVEHRNLDASVCEALKAEILCHLEERKTLVIDLKSVEFADSAGLGMLLSLVDRGKPGQVILAGVGARLERILQRIPRLLLLREFSRGPIDQTA